jgi:hypothetical protein
MADWNLNTGVKSTGCHILWSGEREESEGGREGEREGGRLGLKVIVIIIRRGWKSGNCKISNIVYSGKRINSFILL